MLQALGQLLPIAVAIALSTVPIMATVLILMSPNRDRSSVPFLIGWVVGIAAMAGVFTLGAQAFPAPGTRGPHGSALLGLVQIFIGLALVALAVISWRRGRAHPTEGIPRWLRRVGSFGPWSSFGLAMGLNVRPKALLLSAAAGLSLRVGSLSPESTLIVLGIFAVLASATVSVPIVAAIASPERAETWLVASESWINRNSRTVTNLIVVVIGVVILGNGLRLL
ncbi:hypothetical protein GY21_13930 [Cryobacterium roopkundense]|uniref:GAP family protein n=1 Tax=Cryobacterium roopkundense TaxID=1001240 RepID=A0A099J596_9MICO|nr:GAP family protein [Cryobacterium roopkundense]KGJ72657.1 hypothetical protein GY21_13930 [Cryobacterium roopkundense]MBB5641225.1 hypothetical protein [Cryobacterium roopkundense]